MLCSHARFNLNEPSVAPSRKFLQHDSRKVIIVHGAIDNLLGEKLKTIFSTLKWYLLISFT